MAAATESQARRLMARRGATRASSRISDRCD
jgi:hypothetical protein